jgi:hypothetical protein
MLAIEYYIDNTSFSSYLMNGPNKTVRYTTLGLPETNSLAYLAIHKLRRKCSIRNMTPGAVFTTVYFLSNLQNGPISKSVTLQ